MDEDNASLADDKFRSHRILAGKDPLKGRFF